MRLALCWLAILGACSTPKRSPPPADPGEMGRIPGIGVVRWWGDEEIPELDQWMAMSEPELARRYPALYGQEHHYLAISGGGANGAYGAGLLCGLTEAGRRPEYTMVTGVSTGALTAPFAFLGPKYDPVLKEVYTTLRPSELLKKRGALAVLHDDAIADSDGLRKMIAKYVTAEVVAEIATEHRRGRSIFIATTNLDAGRAVVWNLGRIAISGSPDALDLIHRILLASASVPGAFPPVMIEVELDGKRYDEMHVDGGASAQVFLYPGELDFDAVTTKLRVKGKPAVYVIRNAFLEEEWRAVDRRVISIAGRTINSMIRSQGLGDLYRIYLLSLVDGMEYHQTFIPAEFAVKSKEPFDPEYMSALFEFGRQRALKGEAWQRHPPGMQVTLGELR
jgi:predicted patatin/cPLA2 family phospholipase